MCRAIIPDHIMKNPKLTKNAYKNHSKPDSLKIFWCYESHRSQKTWWKYDNRTSQEIEKYYQKYLADIDQTFHDLQIAGEIYEIDFSTKRQYRKNQSGKRRLIVRSSELQPSDVIVGTAGIKSLK